MEEFQAETWKLLKEEIESAIDTTVSDFIAHLKEQ